MASAPLSEEDRYVGLLEIGNPSEVKDEYWIWAVNRTNMNNRRPDREQENTKCGKWLIFDNMDTIDETWEKVKKAVTTGELGFLAKVSTMKDKQGTYK